MMKKLIFLFALLIVAPVLMFAQISGDTSTVVNIPDSIYNVIENPQLFFNQLGSLIGLIIFITGNFIIWLKLGKKFPDKKWPKLAVAIVVGLVLSILTKVVNWGLFAGDPWLDTILWSLGIGAVAGGLTDIPTMKIALNIILSLVRLKKPTA